MQRGTNLGRLGDFNQAVILESIRRASEGISRVELAESTGLSPQTISNVVRRLLDDGLVREDRTVVSGPGKPRTVLELEPDRLLAVGIHLDPSVVAIVVLNLCGTVVASRRLDTPDMGDPQRTIALIAGAVEDLIAESGTPRERIVGVGVAAPGPLDPGRGVVTTPPLLDGWTEVEVVGPLSRALGLKVLLEKDTIATAIAEVWNGSGQARDANFASIYVGTGVGAGMVLGGEVLRGASNNAGEIGHFIVGQEADEPCLCGRRDCLAATTSQGYAARKAAGLGLDLGLREGASVAERGAAMLRLAELADAGDERALAVVREAALAIGAMVSQLVNALDVDRVVFGGPMWDRMGRRFLEDVAGVINDGFVCRQIHGIRVENSGLGPHVAAIGGACAVLDSALSPKASVLLLR